MGDRRYFIQDFKRKLFEYFSLSKLDPVIVDVRSDFYVLRLYVECITLRNIERNPDDIVKSIHDTMFGTEAPEEGLADSFDARVTAWFAKNPEKEFWCVFLVDFFFDFIFFLFLNANALLCFQ